MANWHKKTDEWVRHEVLTPEQQADILAFEAGKKRPFHGLALMWLGVFSFFLGIISLVADFWGVIPDWGKLAGGGVLLAASIAATLYFFRREHHLLAEVGLFLTFLVIGGAIGLVAQVFNIPMESGKGFLIWAALSFILVLMSRRELLPLLWVPLFLGGILGYLRLELLLLFFEQMPIVTTSVLAGGLLALIYMTGLVRRPLTTAVNRWSIVLFYVVLMLGENGESGLFRGFGVTALFLGLLALYAFRANRVRLFNLTLLVIAIRLVILYYQVFESLGTAGIGLSLTGGLILGGVGYVYWRRSYKSIGK